MLTSALNFGLPSPINIQVEGNSLETGQEIAREIKSIVESVPGTVDVRIKQKLDYPQLTLDIDRTKAAMLGLNAEEPV
jgi:Cu/Ag efflux pump CusA